MLITLRRFAASPSRPLFALLLLSAAAMSAGCDGDDDPLAPKPGNTRGYLVSAEPDTIVHEDSQVIIPADMFTDDAQATIATSNAPELSALPAGVAALTQAVRFSADVGSLQDQPDSVRVAKALVVTMPALSGVKAAGDLDQAGYARVAVEIPGWGTMMVYGMVTPSEDSPGGYTVEIPELFYELFATEAGELQWEAQVVSAGAHLDVQPRLFHVLGMTGSDPLLSEVTGRIDVPVGKGLVLLIHGWSMDESAQFDGEQAAERVAGYWREAVAYFHGQAAEELDMYCLFYDEDLDLADIGSQLQEKAAQWFDPAVHGRAIVVAHSMGGLVTRVWMNRNQGAQVVEKSIFLDTPHHGSALANIFLGPRALVPLFFPTTGAQNLLFDTGLDFPGLQWRANPFLADLNENEAHWQDYFLVGGIDAPDHLPTIATQTFFFLGHAVNPDPRLAEQSDGIVELGSQLPDDLYQDDDGLQHELYHEEAKCDPAVLAYCLQKIRENIGPVPDPGDQFVRLPAGTFTMGSPTNELGRGSNETQHQVTLTHDFFIQTTEVTNAQYVAMLQWAYERGYVTVSGINGYVYDHLDGSTVALVYLSSDYCQIEFSGSVFTTAYPERPMVMVNWYGAASYCDWLSLKEGLPRTYDHSTWAVNQGTVYGATGYRLPTEAEWEYACRAGSTTAFSNGLTTDNACNDPVLDQIGWYCGNSGSRSHDVGTKPANWWGLYDMHGNVWEWCHDWYTSTLYAAIDPQGPDAGSYRVIRGGRWLNNAHNCRSANRYLISPAGSWLSSVGFRPARSAF